jgi:ubiquinone/menaquinone biosynthesis C-methylase UbiE
MLNLSDTQVGKSNESVRVTWLEKALEKIPSGSRILDAGAGELQFKKFCTHLDYVAQDFAQYDGQGDSKGLQMGTWDQTRLDIVCDITEIPEPEASFDAILCVEVFEHLPNPVLALKEFSRLLKPGGQLIITAPFCSLTHFAPYHFATGFNSYFYETHLRVYGFEIVELSRNGNYFEYLAQEVRRIPQMSKQYSSLQLNKLEKLALKILLKLLRNASSRDRNSSEILCFGLHVVARKSTEN